jgi:hypothetical protein
MGKDKIMSNEVQVAPKTIMSNLGNRIAALKQQVIDEGEIWQPHEGDSLVGFLIGQRKVVGPYGENFQILIQDENGAITAAWVTPRRSLNLLITRCDCHETHMEYGFHGFFSARKIC